MHDSTGFPIVERRQLNPEVVLLRVLAPRIAKAALPGQFIILRIDERGERIPLTIAEADPANGLITVIFQTVGATTRQLGTLQAGDSILDFTGPLGKPSELDGVRRAAVIGGGLGTAIAYPQAKYLHQHGAEVDLIAGFRNKSLIILEDELKTACTNLVITTDDGSNGRQGFVTDALKSLIEAGNHYDLVVAIGPLIMMKFVCKTTAPYGIKTVVSMNPIMIDGTGMCGGCRVTVGGETKFACVDGPDFDGHLVDFDEAIRRSKMYKPQETHACNLLGGAK